MFDQFLSFLSVAAFFTLHGLVALAVILLGLKLNQIYENYLERSKQKTMQALYRSERR